MAMKLPRRLSHDKRRYNMSWMLMQAKVCMQSTVRERAEHLFRALQRERAAARENMGFYVVPSTHN